MRRLWSRASLLDKVVMIGGYITSLLAITALQQGPFWLLWFLVFYVPMLAAWGLREVRRHRRVKAELDRIARTDVMSELPGGVQEGFKIHIARQRLSRENL